jgi:hypothetical protein
MYTQGPEEIPHAFSVQPDDQRLTRAERKSEGAVIFQFGKRMMEGGKP